MTSFLAFFNFDNTLFILGLLGFFGVLLTWQLTKDNSIDLKSLLIKDGEVSLSKLGQLIAMLVSTWIIIYQTRNGLLTEWLFTGYMIAWSGANLVSKWIDRSSSFRTNYGGNYRPTYQFNEPEPADPTDYRDFRASQIQKKNT